jgi:hypothetical protein
LPARILKIGAIASALWARHTTDEQRLREVFLVRSRVVVRDAHGCWTGAMQTLENPVIAKFAFLEFSEVALLSPTHPQGVLRVVPKGIMKAPGRPYLEKGEVHHALPAGAP